MKKSMAVKKLITSLVATVLLLYFMIKSPSPKLIFIPFLICSFSMAGKSIARILNKQKMEYIFGKIFVLGFLVFFIGFLVLAGYISIRDKNYSLLIFSIPFWIVGIFLFKNRFLKKKEKTNEESFFTFAIIVSSLLVAIVFIVGVFFLVSGIKNAEFGLILGGVIFTFGSLVFGLAALTIKGCFEKSKVDVLGIYAGAVIAIIGISFIPLMCKAPMSSVGLWIIIPILMVVAGIYQVIKCIKNKK